MLSFLQKKNLIFREKNNMSFICAMNHLNGLNQARPKFHNDHNINSHKLYIFYYSVVEIVYRLLLNVKNGD